MTETGATTSTAAPIPVLAYESPADPTAHLARIRWWILTGGIVSGAARAGASIASRIGYAAILKSVPTLRRAQSIQSSVLEATYITCELLIAFACLAMLLRKLSSRATVFILLCLSGILASAFVIGIFSQAGSPPALLRIFSITSGLTILLWPLIICWTLTPETRGARPTEIFLRRLCWGGLLFGALLAIETVAFFAYVYYPFAGSQISRLQAIQYFVRLATGVICASSCAVAISLTRSRRPLLCAAVGICLLNYGVSIWLQIATILVALPTATNWFNALNAVLTDWANLIFIAVPAIASVIVSKRAD